MSFIQHDLNSYCWFSPQSLHDQTFTVESDIWTFGVTLWEMFAMKRPFHCSLTGQVLSENEVNTSLTLVCYLSWYKGICEVWVCYHLISWDINVVGKQSECRKKNNFTASNSIYLQLAIVGVFIVQLDISCTVKTWSAWFEALFFTKC